MSSILGPEKLLRELEGRRYGHDFGKLEGADSHNAQVPTSNLPAHSAKDDPKGSRRVESGIDILDNNAVNVLMALIMSVGGMLIMSYVWDLPFMSIAM